jgi:hypothetical protein
MSWRATPHCRAAMQSSGSCKLEVSQALFRETLRSADDHRGPVFPLSIGVNPLQ